MIGEWLAKTVLAPLLQALSQRGWKQARTEQATARALEGGDTLRQSTLRGILARELELLSERSTLVEGLEGVAARQWLRRPETLTQFENYILGSSGDDAPLRLQALHALEQGYAECTGEHAGRAAGPVNAAAEAVFARLHHDPDSRQQLQLALTALVASGMRSANLPQPAPTAAGVHRPPKALTELLPFLRRRQLSFSDRQMQAFVPLRLLRTSESQDPETAAEGDEDPAERAVRLLDALWARQDDTAAESFEDLPALLEKYETEDPLYPNRPCNRMAWIVVGAPGSGKSTLLAAFERRVVEQLLLAEADAGAGASGTPGAHTLCLRFGLGAYDVRDGSEPDPEAWIEAQWRERWQTLGLPAPELKTITAQFRVRLLLDGLNEIRARNAEQRERAALTWARWLARRASGAGPFAQAPPPVFSVRTLNVGRALRYHDAIEGLHAAPWRVDVDAMDAERIQQFIHANAGHAAQRIWDEIGADDRLLGFYGNPFNLYIQCEYARMRRGGEAQAPVLRSRAELMCAQVWSWLWRGLVGRDPPEDALLVDNVLTPRDREAVTGRRWGTSLRLLELPDEGSLLRGLGNLAWTIHSDNDGALVAMRTRDAIAAAFPESVGTADTGFQRRSEDWWRAVVALNVVGPPEDGRNGIQFAHHLHQEFHAACKLAATASPSLRPGTLAAPASVVDIADGRVVMPQPSPWEECIKMATALARQPASLIEAAIADGNLALAARALRVLHDGTGAWAAQHAALSAALLARMQAPDLALGLRWEAGLCLGLLGDRIRFAQWRPAAHGGAHAVLLPRWEQWIDVRPGSHWLGDDDPNGQFLSPGAVSLQRIVKLAFAPVTNAEYACFIDAGACRPDAEGQAPRCWQVLGEAALQWWNGMREAMDASEDLVPRYWGQERFSNPLQPVVGVSAFEAAAYVLWLDDALRPQLQALGVHVTLPIETEWEAAARGGTGQPWPWGQDDDTRGPERMNCDHWYERPTPVGMLPEGAVSGLHDLSGNVWEWTIAQAPDAPSAGVCIRGGSWSDPEFGCQAALRLLPDPQDRDDNLGFRLALCLDPLPALR